MYVCVYSIHILSLYIYMYMYISVYIYISHVVYIYVPGDSYVVPFGVVYYKIPNKK